MIKKNTKIIFENKNGKETTELTGGMPLAKGDIVHMHQNKNIADYEVVEKIIDCFLENEDQTVNITYKLKKV